VNGRFHYPPNLQPHFVLLAHHINAMRCLFLQEVSGFFFEIRVTALHSIGTRIGAEKRLHVCTTFSYVHQKQKYLERKRPNFCTVGKVSVRFCRRDRKENLHSSYPERKVVNKTHPIDILCGDGSEIQATCIHL
jgi:hypothetical protein